VIEATLSSMPLTPPAALISQLQAYERHKSDLMADCDEQTARDTLLFAPAGAALSITKQIEHGFSMFSTASPKAASDPQQLAAKEKAQSAQVPDAVVRVSSQKLDRLVALVGELVINQSHLSGVAVLGGYQRAIRSLGRVYREIEVVSGATITGDGRIAFLLNIDGIVRRTRLTAARSVEGGSA
jgi:chemotaxis protein histidine kinase CheA